MTPDMSARFRDVTESLVARLRQPTAKAQLEIAQAEGVDQLLGQLAEAQQAMNATAQAMYETAGTLAEATAAMRDAAAPKRVELIRDAKDDRPAGFVVHQGGQPPRHGTFVRDEAGQLIGAE